MNILYMKNSGKYLCCFLIFMLLATVGMAQDNTLNQIKTSFNKYQADIYQEKIFVHTDKDFYLAGELLWFKSYNTMASGDGISELSKVVYLELLDRDQNAVLQTKAELKDGAGSGSLFLPVTLASGNYILRAYTSWMRNFSPDLFFEKKLTIVNSLSSDSPEPVLTENYDIQFFPEGGNLIAGLENRVAFRVACSSGAGIKFSGLLMDANGDTVARFSPLKFGIGNFSFIPRPNTVYRAEIIPEDTAPVKSAEFPKVVEAGYNMLVNVARTGKMNVQVGAGKSNASGAVYLVVHSRGQISLAEKSVISNGTAAFSLDTDKMADGVSVLTVFDANRNPVAERLYFKRPQRKLQISVRPDGLQHNLRSKVTVAIESSVNASPAGADMSVSVYRADSNELASPADIFQYQWLVSELRGNIENPGFYFDENQPEADLALDNLMLTQGWRRFQWNDILGDREPIITFLPEYEGHIIRGSIKDRRTGNPAAGIMTFLSVPSKRTQIYSSRSDEKGRLNFFTRDFFGPGEIIVQTDVQQDSVYEIEIENPFSESPAAMKATGFRMPEFTRSTLQEDHISTQVQNAFFADKLRIFSVPEIDSAAFYGKPESVYLLDDYVRFKTTEEILREYVPSVVLFRQRGNFNVVVDKKIAGGLVGSVPLLILDGVPMFDRGNKIMAYDPALIRKLEVSTKNSFLGDTTFNSIVSFTTFKGNLESFDLDPRDLVLDYEGLQLQREFYSPVYESESQRLSRLPDLRHLLSWLPNLKTGSTGKSNFSFYTSDEAGKYLIVIQGISAGGDPGSGMISIEVK